MSSEVVVARDQLVTAVLRYLSAERALQGSTPHASAADELEYAEEMVDRAALSLAERQVTRSEGTALTLRSQTVADIKREARKFA